MKKILHPTDFSPTSEHLFGMLCSIAREQGAEIVVLNVITEDQVPLEGKDSEQFTEISSLSREARARYQQLCAHSGGVPTSFQIKVGPLVKTIAEVATGDQCDLIGLATFPHSYVEQQYHGGVAHSLLQIAPCPVLCFRESCFHQPQVVFETEQPATETKQRTKSNSVCCVERQW